MLRTLPGVALAFALTAGAVGAQDGAVGSWDFTTISPEGEFKSELVIRSEGGKLTAIGRSANGERAYDSIEVSGSKITLVITISYNGSPMVITYRGEVQKTEMSGDADFGGLATGTWAAARKGF